MLPLVISSALSNVTHKKIKVNTLFGRVLLKCKLGSMPLFSCQYSDPICIQWMSCSGVYTYPLNLAVVSIGYHTSSSSRFFLTKNQFFKLATVIKSKNTLNQQLVNTTTWLFIHLLYLQIFNGVLKNTICESNKTITIIYYFYLQQYLFHYLLKLSSSSHIVL